ncbi:hypothetical protein JW905_11595, partial [bacterium]|nr:hypothetical protein [candidate division CSSED10-310 bacterium]
MNYTRGMAAAAQLCALAVIAIMCVFPVENNDVFINLKTGEYILEHRALPATDPFSFTAGDQPWVNHEWLSILLLFLTYKAGGLNLLILLKAFMIVLSFGVILREAGRWSGNSWLLPFLVLLTGYAASDRFIIRMHIFNNLLLAVYLAALLRWRDRGGRGLWLPVITLAWVNLHSGAIVAPLLMVVVMAGDWLQRLAEGKFSPARREPERYSFRQGLIALALHVPALCLTPYGYKTVLYPLQQASWDIYRHYVFEWMRVYSPFYIQMPVFKAFLAVAAVLVGAFIVNWRRLRISDLGLAAVGLVMGASAVRFMDILALIALAVTARQLASMNWAHGRDRFRLYHQTA